MNTLLEGDLVSDIDGNIKLEDLMPGTYYLMEKKSPGGYRLPANSIKIELIRDGDGLYAVIDGTEYHDTDNSASIYIEKGTERTDAAHVAVVNYKRFSSPLSGGQGIFVMFAMALAGLGFSSVLFIKHKKY